MYSHRCCCCTCDLGYKMKMVNSSILEADWTWADSDWENNNLTPIKLRIVSWNKVDNYLYFIHLDAMIDWLDTIIILIVLILAIHMFAVHFALIMRAFSQLAILFPFTVATPEEVFTAFSITFLFLFVSFPSSIWDSIMFSWSFHHFLLIHLHRHHL